MTCRQFRRGVVALADGEVPTDEARRMREHAAKCPTCAAELAAVKRESEIYAAAMQEPGSPGELADAVMSRLGDVHILVAPSPAVGPWGIPVKWVILHGRLRGSGTR